MTNDADGTEPSDAASRTVTWHVQLFQTRKTVTRVFGGRKRVSVGFGWSASGDPEGYEYHPGPFKTLDAAAQNARDTIGGLGGTVGDITESGVPIDMGN